MRIAPDVRKRMRESMRSRFVSLTARKPSFANVVLHPPLLSLPKPVHVARSWAEGSLLSFFFLDSFLPFLPFPIQVRQEFLRRPMRVLHLARAYATRELQASSVFGGRESRDLYAFCEQRVQLMFQLMFSEEGGDVAARDVTEEALDAHAALMHMFRELEGRTEDDLGYDFCGPGQIFFVFMEL